MHQSAMDTPHIPVFVSNEYVQRWLAEIEPKETDPPGNITQNADECCGIKAHESDKRAEVPKHALDLEGNDNEHQVKRIRHIQRDHHHHNPATHYEKQRSHRPVKAPQSIPSPRQGRDPVFHVATVHHYQRTKSVISHSSIDSKSSIPKDPAGLRNSNPDVTPTQAASLKYARRLRHKTKVDKYEYKGAIRKDDHTATVENIKKPKSIHHRRKSGAALNQEFKAPNISQKRITLKIPPGLGIFNRGKVSDPVPLRGLPDLTFSEMSFLTKGRRIDDARFQQAQSAKSNQRKAKGLALEISGCFSRSTTASKESHQNIQGSVPPQIKSRPSTRSHARSSPAKLEKRTALNTVQIKSSIKNTLSECNHFHVNSKGSESQVQDHSLARGQSQSQPKHPIASYRSRSLTPPRDHLKKLIHARDSVVKRTEQDIIARSECSYAESRRTSKRPFAYPAIYEPLSDRSAEAYTRYALLGSVQELWKGEPQSVDNSKIYSLDDLKGLARVAELDKDTPIKPKAVIASAGSSPEFHPPREREVGLLPHHREFRILPIQPMTAFHGGAGSQLERGSPGHDMYHQLRYDDTRRPFSGDGDHFNSPNPLAWESCTNRLGEGESQDIQQQQVFSDDASHNAVSTQKSEAMAAWTAVTHAKPFQGPAVKTRHLGDSNSFPDQSLSRDQRTPSVEIHGPRLESSFFVPFDPPSVLRDQENVDENVPLYNSQFPIQRDTGKSNEYDMNIFYDQRVGHDFYPYEAYVEEEHSREHEDDSWNVQRREFHEECNRHRDSRPKERQDHVPLEAYPTRSLQLIRKSNISGPYARAYSWLSHTDLKTAPLAPEESFAGFSRPHILY